MFRYVALAESQNTRLREHCFRQPLLYMIKRVNEQLMVMVYNIPTLFCTPCISVIRWHTVKLFKIRSSTFQTQFVCHGQFSKSFKTSTILKFTNRKHFILRAQMVIEHQLLRIIKIRASSLKNVSSFFR